MDCLCYTVTLFGLVMLSNIMTLHAPKVLLQPNEPWECNVGPNRGWQAVTFFLGLAKTQAKWMLKIWKPWRSKSWDHTVDGSFEIRRSLVEVGSLSHDLQSFLRPTWCRISSINNMLIRWWFDSVTYPTLQRITYATLEKGKSSTQKCRLVGDMLVP